MENYCFSVAMCVYGGDNAENFDVAVQSILNQTVSPSEVVLVVDGPIDRTLNDVIEKYERNFLLFKVLRLQENGGLGNALRIAVDNCSYELIARMDSDDIALPNRFEEQLRIFKSNPNLDIVGADISEFIGAEDNVVGYRRLPTQDLEIKKYLKHRCPFNHMTVMYKKCAVQQAGGYIDWFWNEDYYLWIRMLEQGAHFANTGTVLVNVRVGTDMYARRGGKEYFQSEVKLQKYMLNKKIIGYGTYCSNIVKRWIVQRCLPNSVRGWVFRKLARSK